MKINTETLNLIRCQECLHELHATEEALECSSCKKVYPLKNGLIFMGFDARRKDEIYAIIEEEREHQNDLEALNRHFKFAYGSFRIALLSINLLQNLVKGERPVALDVGSGGSPFSQMLAKNGFDTFRVELDPNSLYSGLFYQHPNLTTGKHIVADGSLLPFADDSVDVVFCKEFIHHIKDYHLIFAEINRVLKPGGTFLMIEPANKFKFLRTEAENDSINRPGHHLSTIFHYGRSLHKNGFELKRYYLYHYKPSKRFKFVNKLKDYYTNQIKRNETTNTSFIPLKMLMQRIISGQNVIFAQKVKKVAVPENRPRISVIEPSQLILDTSYIQDPRLNGFNTILKHLESELSLAEPSFSNLKDR